MKKYLKGFGKGLLFLLILGIIFTILEQIKINSEPIAILGNFIVPPYIFSVYKRDKQPNTWIILSLIIGFIVLPFYFGAAEISKNKIK